MRVRGLCVCVHVCVCGKGEVHAMGVVTCMQERQIMYGKKVKKELLQPLVTYSCKWQKGLMSDTHFFVVYENSVIMHS